MKQARDPEALQAVIDESKLSLRQLAALAGCSHPTPRRLLNGHGTNDAAASRIARVLRGILKRPLDDLFVDAVSSEEQQIVESREAVA